MASTRACLALLLGLTGILLTGCPSSSVVSIPAPAASPTPSNSPGSSANTATFWVEPTTSTLIGVGQLINVYPVFKSSSSAPYPSYLDASTITWTSSNPAVASISANGNVVGAQAGTTTITAQYGSYSTQLTVTVSGNYVKRTVYVSAAEGTRSYAIYVPDFGATPGPHPLIVSMHGGGGSAMIQASTSLLNVLAQNRKAYIAYPEGTGTSQTFNAGACCGYAQSHNVDDVAFIGKLLDDVEANYSVNTSKIYITGFSNGAIMAHRIACTLADRIAGFAPLSGGSGEFDDNHTQYYTCSPTRPVPMVEFHATNDRNYPINGGTGDGSSGTPFYSVPSTISDWLTRNNLTTQSTTEVVNSIVTCTHYTTVADSSKPSAPVTLCVSNPPDIYDATDGIVFGGGHSWPGGVRSPSSGSDVPITNFSADDYIWSYFGN